MSGMDRTGPGKTPFALEEMGLKWKPTGADVTRDELPAGCQNSGDFAMEGTRDPYQTGVDRELGAPASGQFAVRLVRVQPGEGKADPRLASV